MSLRDPDSEQSGLTCGQWRGEKSHLWDLNPGPALYESGGVTYAKESVLQAVLQEPTLLRLVVQWKRLPLHIRAAIGALTLTVDSEDS
jgi:hypothetical protein